MQLRFFKRDFKGACFEERLTASTVAEIIRLDAAERGTKCILSCFRLSGTFHVLALRRSIPVACRAAPALV